MEQENRVGLIEQIQPSQLRDLLGEAGELRLPKDSRTYPYAHPTTFQFFKEAIEEGAHIKTPERFRGESVNRLWARMRNIAGIYYTSDATLEEIGKRYGFLAQKERTRQIIEKFIKNLWLGCSEELRRKFPLEQIISAKPITEKTIERRSLARGGKRVIISACMRRGLTPQDTSALTGWDLCRVNEIYREKGKLPPSGIVINRQLARQIVDTPDDTAVKQRLLDSVSRRFFAVHREMFLTASECLQLARLGGGANRKGEIIASVLRKAGVPVRALPQRQRRLLKGRVYIDHIIVILVSDRYKAVKALKNAPELKRSA